MVLKHPFWLITWLLVALIALVPSCIIFTQALRAGSSNLVIVYLMALLMLMYPSLTL